MLSLVLCQMCAPGVAAQVGGSSGRSSNSLDLSNYGARVAPEPRLIVMMAALDAAGFDPTPAGRNPSEFRKQVRADQAQLDANLRARLRRFYELNQLKDPAATFADKAARYVSLAYALGPAPAFETPPRTDDLFAGVLEVLDFASLLREFYRSSGIEARLPAYLRAYQAVADELRRPVGDSLRAVTDYLHTRPITTALERIPVKPVGKPKKNAPQVFTTREHERRFIVVPDLLGAPGAFNFRVVGDDYYAVVPFNFDPASAELRRAYLQFLIDPLVLRHSREIALRRADIRALLNEHGTANKTTGTPKPAANAAATDDTETKQFIDADGATSGSTAPDIFDAVGRSFVAAADARMNYATRAQRLTFDTTARLRAVKEADRPAITKAAQAERSALDDELSAQLADAYERGAVLAFHFADALRDQEIAGFDFANFFGDVVSRFDLAREKARPVEYAASRLRALEARRQARLARAAAASTRTSDDEDEGTAGRHQSLIKNLDEVGELLRLKNYEAARTRLLALTQEFQGEPRVFFALAQTESGAAQDAFDETVRDQRLQHALGNYQTAINAASVDTDRALVSRARTARGRIFAFLERRADAMQEFDAAIKLGRVSGGAYEEAVAAKQQLNAQP